MRTGTPQLPRNSDTLNGTQQSHYFPTTGWMFLINATEEIMDNTDYESQSYGETIDTPKVALIPPTSTEEGTQEESTNAQRCYFTSIVTLLLMLSGVLLWNILSFYQGNSDPIATCGDCHCITTKNQTCPSRPRSNFSNDEIDAWASQIAINPYALHCNPYGKSKTCKTDPPQDESLLALGESAVCALHFERSLGSDNRTQTCKGASYRLVTYASAEEAKEAGGFVTHTGHCGVCSTMQDLAAYLKSHDLTTKGKICAMKSSLGFREGLKCYRKLGLTDACASIWVYNSLNTASDCFKQCVVERGAEVPNNGPPPECKLNKCLNCDEKKSGPNFQRFAGRTRRRSGLLSAIARPCGQLVSIEQESCPRTTPRADLPSLF